MVHRYRYFWCAKTALQSSSSCIECSKWRLHQDSFVVVLPAEINICRPVYLPIEAPKSRFRPLAHWWKSIAILALPPSACRNWLKNADSDDSVNHLMSYFCCLTWIRINNSPDFWHPDCWRSTVFSFSSYFCLFQLECSRGHTHDSL